MGVAAKHLDPIVGIDMHMVQPPPPAPPIMMPIPFAGYLIDPNDYGSCKVRVNGFPPARAGTPGIACPPHIPPGGMFVKPPTNECEMFQGSSTVVFAGDAAAAQGNPVLTCHDVGMPAPARSWRKSPAKSLMLAAANVIPIPGPSAVMIHGAPTITMAGSAQEPSRQDEKTLTTIRLEVFDAFGDRLGNAKFELRLPNGDVEEGTLDGDGRVTVDEVPVGYSLLVLTDAESDDVPPKRPDLVEPGDGTTYVNGPAGSAGGAAVSHVVAQGDTVRRIGIRYGVPDWKAVLDHPANGAFASARANPNVLLVGDVVNLDPPARPAIRYARGGVVVEAGEDECVYLAPLERVYLALSAFAPGARRPLTAKYVIDGREEASELTGDDELDLVVPMGTRSLRVRFEDADAVDRGALRLRIGDLDPATTTGLHDRLRQLGFGVSDRDPRPGIATFQKAMGLDETAELDEATVSKLWSEHGK